MSKRLEEIRNLKGVMTTPEGIFVALSNEDFDWLIARCEKLEGLLHSKDASLERIQYHLNRALSMNENYLEDAE